jgi:hypothetical protein
MKSLASADTLAQTGSAKENLPDLTFFMISWSLAPLKGGIPESVMNVMTPQDQISHLEP